MRNKDDERLTIHVGNLNDVRLGRTYDYVVMIGVLEYALSFTHTLNPYKDFLNKCKSFLKPGGALIIAIENRLGIKYFAGAPENHTGIVFDGLLEYPSNRGVRTFSRLELKKLLDSCGLTSQLFYYLYPDYKFPQNLSTDENLPLKEDIIRWGNNNEYMRSRHELYPEHLALASMADAGLYREFANAYLVVAGTKERKNKNFPTMVYNRWISIKPEYQISVHFGKTKSGAKTFRKVARRPEARRHLKNIAENCKILTEIYGKEHVAQAKLLSEDVLEMEFIEGERFDKYLLNTLKNEGVQAFYDKIKFYWENILRGEDSDFLPDELNFYASDRQYDTDCSMYNIIIRDGNFVLVDYEFLIPHLSKNFSFYENMVHFVGYNSVELSHYGLNNEDWFSKATGISAEDKRRIWKYYNLIQAAVHDDYFARYRKQKLELRF